MIIQKKAGSNCLAQTPQLSAHIPLTFCPEFKCEVRKTTVLISRKIKEKLKIKKLKEFLIPFQKK